MKLVVDTNIVFSAMLNTNSRVAQILLRKYQYIEFFAPNYLMEELNEHQIKLQKLIKGSSNDVVELTNLITRNIEFISLETVSDKNWHLAEKSTKPVDEDDIAFVALTLELDAILWTGDKHLINKIEYPKIVSTSRLVDIINQIE